MRMDHSGILILLLGARSPLVSSSTNNVHYQVYIGSYIYNCNSLNLIVWLSYWLLQTTTDLLDLCLVRLGDQCYAAIKNYNSVVTG